MKKISILLFILVCIGISITGYLAYVHYSGILATCPLQPQLNCNAVLNSSYSTAVGIPVAVLGLLTYLALLICLFIHEKKESKHNDRILLFLPAVGVAAAGFYSALMIFRLGAICIWCEASHLTMLTIFIVMARHIRPHWQFKKIFLAWILLILIGASGTLFVSLTPDDNPAVLDLAKCLTQKGVKMYGAYWCPHCKEQKRLFGSAFKDINYVECADASNPRLQLEICKTAGIEGYPTWDFNGEKIAHGIDLPELAQRSGCEFKG